MIDWNGQTHPGIQNLTPYRPGKSIEDLYRERGITDAIKLASNENPLGCSSLVTSALASLTAENIAMYPGAFHHPLKIKIANKLAVSSDQVVLANGSDSLFALIFTLFCLNQQKKILTHQHCFPSYPIQAKGLGIAIEKIPLDDNWQWAVSSMVDACSADTGVIIFANPNNPTGVKVHQECIKELLESIPSNIIVVIDEAYYEYAFSNNEESALPLLKQFHNIIITRSFSKAYGLAGLRLGYAIAHEDIIELIWRIQQPFAVNGIALLCGNVAWDDQSFVQQSIELNRQGLIQMGNGMEALGYQYIPSNTNFITMYAGTRADKLNNFLLSQGVIVRPLLASGMPHHLRISIGTEQQNKRFLDALGQFSSKKLDTKPIIYT